MSGVNNLDRSLQDIISAKPKRGGIAKRRGTAARGGARAPLNRSSPMLRGGRATLPSGANYDGTSKVIVSNLVCAILRIHLIWQPLDVNEQQIRVCGFDITMADFFRNTSHAQLRH